MRPRWRVGWTDSYTFQFDAPNGYSCKLYGIRSEVERMARESLPRWLAVAERTGDPPEFIAAIRREISRLDAEVVVLTPIGESP
jgi:hypothetical protein